MIYKRILLKLSGQVLSQDQGFGLQYEACHKIAKSIKELSVQIGIVIGGGNIFRGNMTSSAHMPRTPADHMGMLSTMINGIALKQALDNVGLKAHVLSAIPCPGIVEPYSWKTALKYMDKGCPVIFVGGTGNPYFTTDTAAALRACETNCQILLKATKVDGIFDKDPILHSDAKKIDKISYSQVLAKHLKIMDATAVSLCRDNKLPICVVDVFKKGALKKAVLGEKIGTLVGGEEDECRK